MEWNLIGIPDGVGIIFKQWNIPPRKLLERSCTRDEP